MTRKEKYLWAKKPSLHFLPKNEKKLYFLIIRINKNLKDHVQRLASRRNLTVSELVRRLLIKELEKE